MARASCCHAMAGGRLFVYGGSTSKGAVSALEVLDVARGEWLLDLPLLGDPPPAVAEAVFVPYDAG